MRREKGREHGAVVQLVETGVDLGLGQGAPGFGERLLDARQGLLMAAHRTNDDGVETDIAVGSEPATETQGLVFASGDNRS